MLLEFDMVEEPMENSLELVGSKKLVGNKLELVESKQELEDCIEELGSCNPEEVVNIREREHCTPEQEGCN